jgi:hypothetical protein
MIRDISSLVISAMYLWNEHSLAKERLFHHFSAADIFAKDMKVWSDICL